MIRALIKCIILACLWGGFQSIYFLNMTDEILFSDIILIFGFSEVEFLLAYIIDLSIRFLPVFLFQIFFGTYIYQHFCSAGVYYFSRKNNRIKWFLNESLKLYTFACVYSLIMVITATGIASITKMVTFDNASFILFIYYIIIHSLWLFLTTLLMNILAIRLDSSISFSIVVSLQLFFITTLLLWGNVWPLEESTHFKKHAMLLQFNPMSHVILTWHSSTIVTVNERINHFGIDFSLNTSVFTLLVFSIITIIVGLFIVKNKEWVMSAREG